MIKIKIPATSANMSVGFDSLGIALNLYNEFTAVEAEDFIVSGFQQEYNNSSNLVIKSYIQFTTQYLPISKMKKISLTLTKEDIPISRGLGSSATCILAGVLISNEIHKLDLPLEECAAFASKIETHPDNVYTAVFGNCTTAFSTKNGYYYDTFTVDKNYHFTVLIPEVKGSTEELRNALKQEVTLSDAVFHLSRMIHIPKAISTFQFPLLKELLQDKLHEQYRFPFIPRYKEIEELNNFEDIIACVSGSGSTVLIISKHSVLKKLNQFKNTFNIIETTISNGCEIEVIE